MTIDKLYGYINDLYKSNVFGSDITKMEINEGDDYSSDHGEEFIISIDGTEYNVGYVYSTEDRDDWAQADCYHHEWCKVADIISVSPNDVFKKIEIELRDRKIQNILN